MFRLGGSLRGLRLRLERFETRGQLCHLFSERNDHLCAYLRAVPKTGSGSQNDRPAAPAVNSPSPIPPGGGVQFWAEQSERSVSANCALAAADHSGWACIPP